MAKIFLGPKDGYRIFSDNATIFGVAGDPDVKVIIEADAENVTVNANTGRIDFYGNLADFTFAAGFGTNMEVLAADGTTVIANIPIQNDDDGTQLVFGDGAVNAIFNEGAIRVGDEILSSTAATIIPDPVAIDAGVTSDAGTPSDTELSAKVFLDQGEMFQEINSGATIFGAPGDTGDALIIGSDAENVNVNANTGRIDFYGNLADFTFAARFGANMEVLAADGTTVIAKIPLPEEGTQLVFGDGAVNAIFNEGAIRVGGEILSGTAGTITPDGSQINTDITTGVKPAGGQTISIDSGEVGEGSPEELDASTGGFVFTDDASVSTNVVITGFSSDDVIHVSNTTDEYFFSQEGENVTISYNYNDSKPMNVITLIGVVSADDHLVYSETTFEEAMGFNAFGYV